MNKPQKKHMIGAFIISMILVTAMTGIAFAIPRPQSGNEQARLINLFQAKIFKPQSTAIMAPIPDWKIVFHDEFDDDTLDQDKWTTEYLWGRTNDPELQYYAPDAFLFRNGLLSIEAKKKPTNGMAYSSGVITSFDSFQFTYGYVEARMRIPSGQGLWPALWLLDAGGTADEIDIVEFLGHEPDIAYTTLHYADESGKQLGTGDGHYHGSDFSAGFHTFAVDWQPKAIIWYIDGIEQYRQDHNIPDAPMYLIANLAVGGEWPGFPDDSTHFPALYEIDYIRVFEKYQPREPQINP